LAGIEKLYPLERLDLRDNRLTDPSELARLTGIPDIREIWVECNPFARTHKDYRITIFNLFRKTAGYTEDIIIDGTGPSYSERRYLVERPPIPESVPVVKPKAPEVPTVDMSKPTIVYGTKEGVLWKERPTPKAVMSEVSTCSTRRRKTPKRRIVDLATGDMSTSPIASDVRNTTSPVDRSDAITPEGNYRVSPTPQPQLLSPVVLSDSRKGNVPSPSADVPRADPTAVVVDATSNGGTFPDSPKNWKTPQDWDADAENYRLQIEALRDKIGNGYLSALSEENWDAKGAPFGSSAMPTTSSIGSAHSPDPAQAVQSIHGGRTLGQPLSP